MFRNSLTGNAHLNNTLFPRLVSLNSINFYYSECCFADKLMNCKDKKDGLSREGCGRVALCKATQNPMCYTLACNYASGKLKNTITPKIIKSTGQVDLRQTLLPIPHPPYMRISLLLPLRTQ